MTVREYYAKHLKKLSPEAQFHFTTCLKNWYKTTEFDDYLKANEPSHDLAEIYHDNNYSKVDNLTIRKPYFEKYKGLLGLEKTLFRVNYLLNEYKVDLRRDLLKLIHKDELYTISDDLLSDDVALTTLSDYAFNVICLTEILFPRNRNPFALLAQKTLHFSGDPTLLTHLATHLIICDTDFYTREPTTANLPVYRPLITHCARLINQNLTTTPLETKLNFLICSKIINAAKNPSVNAVRDLPTTWPQAPTGFLPLAQKIQIECQSNLRKSPFLLDPRQPDKNTPDTAEPRNTSFILSSLDQ